MTKTSECTVIHTTDHSHPETKSLGSGTESACHRLAARALGCSTLRGLTQSPTAHGVRYYGPGSTDDEGESVEIRYT